MKTLIVLTAVNTVMLGATLTAAVVIGRKVVLAGKELQNRVTVAESKLQSGLKSFKRAVSNLEL